MADEADVEEALADFVAATLYPNGTVGLEDLPPSAAGLPMKVQRGFPLATDLDAMLELGMGDVTVGARNGVERVTTRYDREWYELVPATRTLTVAVTGNAITLGGTVASPQNVAVRIGRATLFIYPVLATDTLASIAAALAAGLVAQGATAVASGPVVTVTPPNPSDAVAAFVGGYGIAARELKRQEKSFQVTLFAPSPEARDALARLIDPALSELNFLPLPDGTFGLIRYERTIVADTLEKMGEWRRDLFYWVEFPTIETRPAPEMIAFTVNTPGGPVPSR